jgi:RimJ/RimL family protein N-acetyltransferase
VGTQELAADDFAGSRSVNSGSWLTRSEQGKGFGVEMRAAVLELAFAGLGALEAQTSAWHDNPASQRVSLRLGYKHEGQMLLARRAEPTAHLRFRLTRERWQETRRDGIALHGLEPCLALLGAA